MISLQSSDILLENSYAYESTQYGALWVTNDESSTISSSGVNYDDSIVQQCYENVDSNFQYITYQDCDRLRGIDILVQYNFTGLHTAPLFQILADQALGRGFSNMPDLEIRGSISPLPVTQIERGSGQGPDSFLVWFLVSSTLL